jgi:predicted nuclease with TOPRIM domain
MASRIPYTCPDIDAVIGAINMVQNNLEELTRGKHSLLEQLRQSNSELRDRGDELEYELKVMTEERDKLQEEIERLSELVTE